MAQAHLCFVWPIVLQALPVQSQPLGGTSTEATGWPCHLESETQRATSEATGWPLHAGSAFDIAAVAAVPMPTGRGNPIWKRLPAPSTALGRAAGYPVAGQAVGHGVDSGTRGACLSGHHFRSQQPLADPPGPLGLCLGLASGPSAGTCRSVYQPVRTAHAAGTPSTEHEHGASTRDTASAVYPLAVASQLPPSVSHTSASTRSGCQPTMPLAAAAASLTLWPPFPTQRSPSLVLWPPSVEGASLRLQKVSGVSGSPGRGHKSLSISRHWAPAPDAACHDLQRWSATATACSMRSSIRGARTCPSTAGT
jgi:hypothetical protein